jgi:hypothetical protein
MSAIATISRVNHKRFPVKDAPQKMAQVIPLVRGQRVNPELVKEIYNATLAAVSKRERKQIWVSQYSVGVLKVWITSNVVNGALEKKLTPNQLKMAVQAAAKRLHNELCSPSTDESSVRIRRSPARNGGTRIELLAAGDEYLRREAAMQAHPASGTVKIVKIGAVR